MGAVSGIVNTHGKSYTNVISEMIHAQIHRGPDECRVFECNDAVLADCRIEALTGKCEKRSVSENDRVLVVIDGSIYNCRELRAKLTDYGHTFVSDSESETLLHLYENYGSECISRMDGTFSFAIFDKNRRKLVLGRDRLGQRPLLYFMDGDTLVFASEFAALKKYPSFPQELDKESISNFMSLQYIPQPDTVYRNVRKLPPGHLLELNLENNHISIRCYWQADFSIKNSTLSMDSATAKLRTLVEKAVEKR
jgi:asparagine synthase (glutamine-hydrolysing)